MAYFLKKTKNKKGIYLQIYESYYDPERKSGAHRSYKPIGYVHELQNQGIEDPISFFGEEVRKLNQEYQKRKLAEKDRQISSESPERFLGYFPLKNINDSLGCKKYVDLMQTATGFRFHVFDMLSALIYARAVHPCSKSKTYDEVIPKLFEKLDFPWISCIPVWNILAPNMRRSLRSLIIRSGSTIRPTLPAPILTVPTFILRLTGKMISGSKVLLKKTKKSRLLVLGYSSMPIRSRSV